MRTWVPRLLILALVVGVGVWGWRTFFPPPEKAIKKCLADVARCASVAPREGELARLGNAQELAGHFTSDAQITVEWPGRISETINGREDLLRAAIAARSTGRSIRVGIVDVNIRVAPDRQSAEAHFTGTAHVSGESTMEAQEFRARFRKADGRWLIEQAETVRTLR